MYRIGYPQRSSRYVIDTEGGPKPRYVRAAVWLCIASKFSAM